MSKTYAIDNAAGQQTGTYTTPLYTGRQDQNNARLYSVLNAGSSWYSAVAIELRMRMSHGISVQASYTRSHSVDNTGGPVVAGFLPLNTVDGDVRSDRAVSPFDQRDRASINWIWQPVIAKGPSPLLRYLVDGWALSSITTLASGHPVTPLVQVIGQQFSGTTMAYTTTLNGGGGWPRVPFEAFGTLGTGPQYNVDVRLTRTLDIRERLKGVLAFEAFNAFNTQFDTSVNAVAFTAAPNPLPAGVVSGPQSGIIRPVSLLGTGNAASGPRQCQIGFRLVF